MAFEKFANLGRKRPAHALVHTGPHSVTLSCILKQAIRMTLPMGLLAEEGVKRIGEASERQANKMLQLFFDADAHRVGFVLIPLDKADSASFRLTGKTHTILNITDFAEAYNLRPLVESAPNKEISFKLEPSDEDVGYPGCRLWTFQLPKATQPAAAKPRPK